MVLHMQTFWHIRRAHAMYPSLANPTSRMPLTHATYEHQLNVDRISHSQLFDNTPRLKVTSAGYRTSGLGCL